MLIGLVYYFYLTFRGYGVLPFIKKPHKFLMPIPVLIVGLTTLSFLKVSAWNCLLNAYPH